MAGAVGPPVPHGAAGLLMLRVAAASANCISGSKAGKGWSGAHRTLLAFEGLREEKEGGKPCAAALSIGGCAAAGGGCAGSPRQELRPRCYPPAAQSSLCCRAARGLGAAAHWGTELRQRGCGCAAGTRRRAGGRTPSALRSQRRSALRPLAALGLSVCWGVSRARASYA